MTSQAAQSKWRPYPEYKDSGVEWLGEVPEHWGIAPMKYITRFINGAPFKPADWGDEGYPIIRIENLNGGAEFNYTTLQVDPKYHVKQGDLLFAWSGNRGTSFGPFLWNNEGMYYLNQHIFRLDGFELNKEYFYLLLKGVTAHVEKQAHGIIGLVHITKQELGSIGVPVLPEDEQRAIAAFLDHKTAKIDALIEKKQRLIRLLEEKRAAIISHAVTKGLDPDAPMKDSGVEWLGEIPKEWKISKLGAIASVKARIGWRGLKAHEYVDDGYIFLSTPNIKSRYIDFDNVNYISSERYFESPEIMLDQGDILIAKDGSTLGITNVVRVLPAPSTVNSSIAVIRPKILFDSIYIYYFFLSQFTQSIINRMKDGMGVPHLFQADLRKFTLLKPPIEEQHAIAAFLDSETVRIDALISKVQEAINKLQEYRTALISAAVTGKIDVREASL